MLKAQTRYDIACEPASVWLVDIGWSGLDSPQAAKSVVQGRKRGRSMALDEDDDIFADVKQLITEVLSARERFSERELVQRVNL
jgi:hypothetical protein